MEIARKEMKRYATQVLSVKAKYEKLIRKLLRNIAKNLQNKSNDIRFGRIYDATYCEHQWNMDGKGEPCIYLSFTIAESYECGDELEGINFHLEAHNGKGKELLNFIPYNYTPQCWVSLDNPEAIDERFKEFVNLTNVIVWVLLTFRM